MVQPDPFQRTSARWEPWWATALAVVVLLLTGALVCFAILMFYLLISGAQYGILGLPMGILLLLVASVMGLPAMSYLRSRRQRTFVTSMVMAGVIVALIGWLVLRIM